MSRHYSSIKHRHWQRHYHLDKVVVDPVVSAAVAHLTNPVVFNFVNKASLADCVIHGTATPSMVAGSFASGASGFPFDNDATVNSGLTTPGVAGAFLGIYGTDFDQSVNANCVYMGDSIANDYVIRGIGTSFLAYYGDAAQTGGGIADSNSAILSNDEYYEDGVLVNTITPSAFGQASALYIGGWSTTLSRRSKCNMIYAVYAPSIATSESSAAAAIHAAMVEGAP